ncbi:MAG TPA: DUF3500 domain-containing protein [Pirellulales bacterium]|jgi:hypothetical protein|nr:DUF3500 domain-containing protein [Pirellulales bacterium]
MSHVRICSDCESSPEVTRREFLKSAGVAAAAVGAAPLLARAAVAIPADSTPDSVAKLLYESLNDGQRKEICFAWDYTEDKRGLLRSRISNNWNITQPTILSDFYNSDQQAMIKHIFESMIQPDWHKRIYKQLEDDAQGYGEHQSIAMFGKPGEKFEFVMTGRHMTLRCDGNNSEHVAFGGPIFYGHAAQGFNEKPNHPGNVFWEQALEANKVYQMLDGKQRQKALVDHLPKEEAVSFQGAGGQFPGLAIADMTGDQKSLVQQVLHKLIEPYRQSDRDEALACLKTQGGIDKCSLAFYREGDIGDDGVWDCWRLEGPSFVWYYRGAPHVHVWVNVADDAGVKTNS